MRRLQRTHALPLNLTLIQWGSDLYLGISASPFGARLPSARAHVAWVFKNPNLSPAGLSPELEACGWKGNRCGAQRSPPGTRAKPCKAAVTSAAFLAEDGAAVLSGARPGTKLEVLIIRRMRHQGLSRSTLP